MQFVLLLSLLYALAVRAEPPRDAFAPFKRSACAAPAKAIAFGAARSPSVESFRAAMSEAFARLAAERQIGGLSIATLRRRAFEAALLSVPEICVDQPVGNLHFSRSAAQWTRLPGGQCVIQVSESKWPSTPNDLKPLLALHESLGCLDVTDSDFGCSTLLDFLATEPGRERLLRSERAALDEDVALLCLAAGGSFGVGGGGDWPPLKRRWMASRSLTRLFNSPIGGSERAAAFSELENWFFMKFEQN